MSNRTWIIASALSVAFVIGFISLSAWQTGNQLEAAQAELARSRAEAEQHAAAAVALKENLTESAAQIEVLRKEKDEVAKAQQSLEQQMRSALESKDITISELQGKLTVNILDRIMFDSGEAVVKPEGETVLEQIAGILAQFPNRQIHVIGHTDNVPIRLSAKSRFASNWELSTARATAAVRFLSEKAGVDPRRLGAVGYGEFHPLADNATAEGRAKNRRIALVVLSEELAGSDAPAFTAVLPSASVVAGTTNVVKSVDQTDPPKED